MGPYFLCIEEILTCDPMTSQFMITLVQINKFIDRAMSPDHKIMNTIILNTQYSYINVFHTRVNKLTK